ncbi:MAG: winged helix-turn-helix domain-containing protein [Promethearchaeota archaeon]
MTKSDTSSHQNKYQDIINYKPEVLKIISDEETLKLLSDINYENVMRILRKKPMTVQEITKAFNIIAKTCSKTEKKSDKSIYRYLKVLEEKRMVVTAGQRVVMGKTATEKLYMPTARIFQRKDIDWQSERGKQWANRFAILMRYMIEDDGHELSLSCIQEFFEKLTKGKIEALERLVESASDETLQHINEGEWEELVEFVDWVYIFGSLMSQPELLNQLNDCFTKSTQGDSHNRTI